ncbi:MAG TPA: hypothetical protein VNL14_03160 [Candidatus Acidoferrales bacterium]|nr:hypothetical protein [Candidatus Acidoferrales bacterium]
MQVAIDQAKAKVLDWTRKHPHAVLYDESGPTLLDVTSAKSIPLSWPKVSACEEKIHPETGDTYLVLQFESGAQIALVDPGGVAFAPSFVNTGPLNAAPQAVCLRDFYTLKAQIRHYLDQHGDQALPRECLDMMMLCIAILDGARAVGFAVSDLEKDLEKTLREIERRTG